MDEHTNKTPIHFPATNLKDPINGKYVLKLILKDTITAIMPVFKEVCLLLITYTASLPNGSSCLIS